MPVLSIIYPFAVARDIDAALAATVELNLYQMQRRNLPLLYESGVRYQRERCLAPSVLETCERFLTAEQLLRERVGDCDDLSSYRCAELRHRGIDPNARAVVLPMGLGYHAIVLRGDGRIEDPSMVCGMPLNEVAARRLLAAAERRKTEGL